MLFFAIYYLYNTDNGYGEKNCTNKCCVKLKK